MFYKKPFYWPRSRLQPRALGDLGQTPPTRSYASTFVCFASQSALKTIRAKCITSFIPLHISPHKMPKERKSTLTTLSVNPIMLSRFPDLVPSPILPQLLRCCHCALWNSLSIVCRSCFHFSPLNSFLNLPHSIFCLLHP